MKAPFCPKRLWDCERRSLVAISTGVGLDLGLVAAKADGSVSVVVLKTSQADEAFHLWTADGDHLAFDYGNDWFLEPVGFPEAGGESSNIPGVAIVLEDGEIALRLGGRRAGQRGPAVLLETLQPGTVTSNSAVVTSWRLWAKAKDRTDDRSQPLLTRPLES